MIPSANLCALTAVKLGEEILLQSRGESPASVRWAEKRADKFFHAARLFKLGEVVSEVLDGGAVYIWQVDSHSEERKVYNLYPREEVRCSCTAGKSGRFCHHAAMVISYVSAQEVCLSKQRESDGEEWTI